MKKPAFTLIEILIDISIITLVATALLSLMIMNLRSAAFSQQRVVAANLANESIEKIRNLPYDDVATKEGSILPQKNLLDSEEVNYAGHIFTVTIDARYYDDPYDHLATDPLPTNDTAPIDYKKVTVKVFASGHPNALAEIATNIASNAAETISNTGILLVKVVDNPESGDLPIENATVHITNDTLTPKVDITTTTLDDGYAMIPLLPPAGNNTYKVSVTKNGFSTDTTLDPGVCQTDVAPSPSANLNPNIIIQKVTSITMQIRCLEDLEITVKDTAGTLQPNTSVRVQSTRLNCSDPISKYDQWVTTDINGFVKIDQIEHDSYTFKTGVAPACPGSCPLTIVSWLNDYIATTCQTLHSTVVVANTVTYAILTDISPRHPGPTYSGEFNLVGERLDLIREIKFTRTGMPDIVGTIVSADPTSAIITFNMNGADHGSWDLWVKNSFNEISIKNNAIEVTGN